MEEKDVDDKKKRIIGILELIGLMLFTVIGLIIKNLFF